MKRPERKRRSWLRLLEERYARPRRKAGEPVVYPVLDRPPVPYPAAPAAPGKGIPMTISQFIVLGILFIAIAWAGAAGVAYGVVEVSGGGPQGEQGLQGVPGERGLTGEQGPQGPAGNDAAMEMVKRLGTLFAVQQKSLVLQGGFVEFNDPDVGACVEYIITGEPSANVCPGFQQ